MRARMVKSMRQHRREMKMAAQWRNVMAKRPIRGEKASAQARRPPAAARIEGMRRLKRGRYRLIEMAARSNIISRNGRSLHYREN